jgi:hypothetical protein
MDTNLLDIKFARIGARLKVADRPTRRTRTSGEGPAERGLPGLTQAEKATTTARGGDEPLRASFVRGRRPNRRKRWIATW